MPSTVVKFLDNRKVVGFDEDAFERGKKNIFILNATFVKSLSFPGALVKILTGRSPVL